MAIHNNGEPKPNKFGTDAHDGGFEGSNKLYAEHLVKDHGYMQADVEPFAYLSDQSAWSTLNSMHRAARSLDS